jgi:hypothetical protein
LAVSAYQPRYAGGKVVRKSLFDQCRGRDQRIDGLWKWLKVDKAHFANVAGRLAQTAA